jgi:hypothetical protein
MQMREMLDTHEVTVLTGTSLTEVGDGWAEVEAPDGTRRRLAGDATYVCLGMRGDRASHAALADAFAGTGVDVLDVGDSAGGAKIIDATAGGRGVLLTLEARGVLAPR